MQVSRDKLRGDRVLDGLALQPPGVGQQPAGEGRPRRDADPAPGRQEHGHLEEIRRAQGETEEANPN